MATFTLNIPDELLPALVAEFSIMSAAGATSATTPEEYFHDGVVETVRQRAEIYKVGPYFTGPTPPRFNPDGTPYDPEWVMPPPPEPEPDPQDNDTTEPEEVEL